MSRRTLVPAPPAASGDSQPAPAATPARIPSQPLSIAKMQRAAFAAAAKPRGGRARSTLPALPSEAESIIPDVQRQRVRAGNGERLRDALVQRDEWRDPTDRNASRRAPRVIRGYRRGDPLRLLFNRAPGRPVTEQHLVAVDRYRDAYEKASKADGLSKGSMEPTAHRSGPCDGPTDMALRACDAWNNVQAAMVGQRQRSFLEQVVLNRIGIYTWATRCQLTTRLATGYIIAVLDALVTYYRIDDHDLALWKARQP